MIKNLILKFELMFYIFFIKLFYLYKVMGGLVNKIMKDQFLLVFEGFVLKWF